MAYHSKHTYIMADKERIMSLEGQNAELCDRIAELEREKMLREVAEEALLQSKAYELAMKMAKDMLEKERAAIREEESARADFEAEFRLKERNEALDCVGAYKDHSSRPTLSAFTPILEARHGVLIEKSIKYKFKSIVLTMQNHGHSYLRGMF